ncbi:hypothetical protein [Luteimonas notoginsengisoli]|jgi:hypothetical protein|uniref:Uncharacterized protein n=1 Tax=Luteimonas notoginsengisoli TaxID=1578200 RepID=A0ABV7UW20_9GAMM
MRFLIPRICFLVVAGIASGLLGMAFAAGQQAVPAHADASSTAQPAQSAPVIGQPLDPGALDALRGGESVVVVRVKNDGEVNGNHADNVTSGLNAIDGGAFANASGITTVIQNSGSNVLIQNGTAVNVQFADPMP